MAVFFNCGYMRALILQNFDKFHSYKKIERYKEFVKEFENINIEENYFHRKSEELRKFCRKNNWFGDKKRLYLNYFSVENWRLCQEEKKKEHTLNFCQSCSDKPLQKTFPSTGKKVKGKRENESTSLVAHCVTK